MNAKDFDELIESVREAGRILRGEAKPKRGTPASSWAKCYNGSTVAPMMNPLKFVLARIASTEKLGRVSMRLNVLYSF